MFWLCSGNFSDPSHHVGGGSNPEHDHREVQKSPSVFHQFRHQYELRDDQDGTRNVRAGIVHKASSVNSLSILNHAGRISPPSSLLVIGEVQSMRQHEAIASSRVWETG